MANRIALIRHGQTEWSKSGQHTSTTDIDLYDEGVHQAMTIPSLLWGLDLAPATVWSSPRLRAQRTAVSSRVSESERQMKLWIDELRAASAVQIRWP